jgi:hypothetical protein
MKTIRKWLETLPEPYRKLALSNLETNPMEPGRADKQCETVSEALFDAFYWNDTPEPSESWYDIHQRARDGEFDELPGIDCTIPEEP